MTRRRFRIRAFTPGALAGSRAYFDPVSLGAIDAAFGTPAAHRRKNAAFGFFANVPFGPDASEFIAWIVYGGGAELARQLYRKSNIAFLPCGLAPANTAGWFRTPLRSVADLAGLKIAVRGFAADMFRRLGAAPQPLTVPAIYPALSRGVIDAGVAANPAIDRRLGLHQVARHVHAPGWQPGPSLLELVINLDTWAALPNAYREMVRTACRAQMTTTLAAAGTEVPEAVQADIDDGVSYSPLPPPIINKLKEAWRETLQAELAANADARMIWQSLDRFRERYRIWGARGYLR
ncbi:MAG: TRAP transporter substrate-binding protein DctP, partial [Pseudomonadota bacterium]